MTGFNIREYWKTKEWNEKKKELIKKKGGKCEWCPSTKELTPCHKNKLLIFEFEGFKIKIPIFNSTLFVKRGGLFSSLLKKNFNDFPDECFEEGYRDSCPKCKKYTNLQERKTIKPKFRCGNCEHVFEEKINIKVRKRLKKEVWNKLYNNEELPINKFLNRLMKETNKEFEKYYKDIKNNCLLLCNKCKMPQHKGYGLCSRCKKKYTKYELCWDCKKIIEDEKKPKLD